MRNTLRIIFGGCLALVVLALVACGGGDDEPSTDNGANDGATPAASGAATTKAPATPAGDVSQGGSKDLFVSNNPIEVLDSSVARFEEDVQSVNARMSLNMVVSGFSVGANGFFLFQSPDQMYMNLKLTGDISSFMGGEDIGPMEILLRDGTMYMNTSFTGWVSESLDDLGDDGDGYENLIEGHSPVDYELLVKSIGADIQDLGEETVDGRVTQHYRVNVDVASLMGAVTGALGGTGAGSVFEGESATGTMYLDIWMEKESQLPYRMTADGAFSVLGESATMTMTVDFLEYNQPVNIPDAPENAKSFADAFE